MERSSMRAFFCLVMYIAAAASKADLPEVTYNDLQAMVKNKNISTSLKDSGGKFSVFVVTKVPASGEYEKAVASFRDRAPGCIGSNKLHPRVRLSDGSTRTTFATSGAEYPTCLGKEMKAMSFGFNKVEVLISRAVEILAGKRLVYRTEESDGEAIDFVHSPHKDHIHVYAKGQEEAVTNVNAGDFLVPFHVDNGIFLLLTPFPGHGLEVRLSDGRSVSTGDVDPSSILVLFGQGLADWLLQAENPDVRSLFHPVPHAVPSMSGGKLTRRSVYARMKVAPATAKPVMQGNASGSNVKQFQDIFSGKWQDSQICSTDLSAQEDPFLAAMDSNCARGDAYCWMGCYPLPTKCPTKEAAICFSPVTNVTCSTEPDGTVMDQTCQWQCKEEDDEKEVLEVNDFCNGKMDMLMFGFKAAGNRRNPCIILFFETWTLDSRVKFAFACVGVLLLGFSIEALIAFRRAVTKRRRVFINMPALTRRIVVLVSFAVNLILGYLAMLVAMTYSIELFAFVVIGIIAGHAVFNMNTAVGDSVDPCCAPSQNGTLKTGNVVSRDFGTRYESGHEPNVSETLLAGENSEKVLPAGKNCCSKNHMQAGSSHTSLV